MPKTNTNPETNAPCLIIINIRPFALSFPPRQAFQETCRKHQLEMFVILASRLKLTRKLRPVIQNFVPTVWTIIHSFSESGG